MKKYILIALSLLCLAGCKKAAEPNFNGIWLWSKFMNEVNLDTLAAKDIKNIIFYK